jgi:DNA-binding MurR/RpiR family transcriptional regulator
MRHWEHKFEVSREGADGVSRYSQLDRAIIQAIVAHISKNEEISLTELAQECHVAKSSVVKA